MHPIVFLVGLHGSGKSTIGRHLAEKHGWSHLSLGDLGRLARKGKRPCDVSLRLMVCMAAFRHGQDMPEITIQAIIGEVLRHANDRPVVCDGFPVIPEHMCRIPKGSSVIEITCDNDQREARLKERELQTLRKWTPGITSLRDSQLPSLQHAAELAGVTYLKIDNSASNSDMISEVALQISKLNSVAS